ncbi:extracellular solute-binding protein [Pseudobacteroides cellulosolvens]|uniref:Copper amine oxidase-like domain-containing protein n=1 Tax=Pseudobacteroides cellulosolvens ATCC 35603 = DSM 2933 TaxID=398512 RepID=A0A0L6JHF8_9FIRM|nr:extracellular solute-binding protein [Pseudobacteroides cellulosolvens]KNY25271.1 copper amine oxidase-like domain-containing protein [Pseudobacteroides cellulosolvens ATCC 35603 = DSM 2933]
MKKVSKLQVVIPVAVFTCSISIASVCGYNAIRKIEATVNDNIKIYYDNKEKVLKEVNGSKISPVIINGRTYLPVRAVADLAGLGIEWDSESQSIKISSSNEGIPYKDNIPIIDTEPTNQNNEGIKGEFSFWYFNKDEAPNIVKAFNEAYPNVKVNLSVIPDRDQQYQNKLTSAIRAGSGVPDVFGVESAFVKRFIDMPDAFADLTELSKDYVGNMIPYTLDVGTDKNGVLRALSHQATPMALAYKKGVSKKYLGTDDPSEIAEMMSTPEKMLQTAKTLYGKSGGKVSLFPTFEEPMKFYLGGRSYGWVADNKLNLDQKMLDFIDFAKTLRNNKFEAYLDQWSPGWSAAIADDEKALVWACPTWGIPWIVGSNDKSASEGGRWGLARPPFPSFWGGTWFGIYSKSHNKDTAWKFLKYFTTNKDAMKKWANNNQDFPNNLEAISEGSLEDSKIMGTNVFKFYETFIKDINGNLLTKYDDTIENCYLDCMRSYLAGKIKTKDEMILTFKDKVKTNLSYIIVE